MGHESHWVSGQVEPRPSVATRLGAELPSSQGTCVTPRGHDCGHQAASATCMSSCVPRPPEWPGPSSLLPCPQCGPQQRLGLLGSGPQCPQHRPCRALPRPPRPLETSHHPLVLSHTDWGPHSLVCAPVGTAESRQTLRPPHRGQLGAWEQLLLQRGTAPRSAGLVYPTCAGAPLGTPEPASPQPRGTETQSGHCRAPPRVGDAGPSLTSAHHIQCLNPTPAGSPLLQACSGGGTWGRVHRAVP